MKKYTYGIDQIGEADIGGKSLKPKVVEEDYGLVEYDGIWHKKDETGDCAKFRMSDLKELLESSRLQAREEMIEEVIKFVESESGKSGRKEIIKFLQSLKSK